MELAADVLLLAATGGSSQHLSPRLSLCLTPPLFGLEPEDDVEITKCLQTAVGTRFIETNTIVKAECTEHRQEDT